MQKTFDDENEKDVDWNGNEDDCQTQFNLRPMNIFQQCQRVKDIEIIPPFQELKAIWVRLRMSF